jgi:hypothetical protein
MKFPRTADGYLAALGQLDPATDEAEARALLERALAHRSNHVVARAAAIVARRAWRDLEPALEAAFDRLCEGGVDLDPGCTGKNALLGAMRVLEAGSVDLYRRGARYRQPEAVYGGREDTAATLRGECAFGLLRLGPWDLAFELARLLADPEFRVRENAARALGDSGHPAAEPLLLHHALRGDAEAVVVGECLRGLLARDAPTHRATVEAFLEDKDPAVRELAALALGESRVGEALPALQRCFRRAPTRGERRCLLLAVGTLRCDEAFACLREVARSRDPGDARDALEALRLSAGDPRVAAWIEEIEQGRPELA